MSTRVQSTAAPVLSGHGLGDMELSVASTAVTAPFEEQDPATAYPLSESQHALWFLEQLCATDAAYTVPLVYRVMGALNVKALERSFFDIVARHSILRTRFTLEDGEPMQTVSARPVFEFEHRTLQRTAESDRQFEAYRMALGEIQRPFDLGKGPLFRVLIFSITSTVHILLISMHHIVTDSWSLRIMITELRTNYSAYSAGHVAPLATPTLQYCDWSKWQRTWMRQAAASQQLAYWQRTLTGSPDKLTIRTDRPRPARQSFNGARVPIFVPKEICARAIQLSRQLGVTLQVILLTAFYLLLREMTGQEDIVIGTPVSGRMASDFHGVIGYFVNTVALRIRVSSDETLAGALRCIRAATAEAYGNQDIPFSAVVSKLAIDRDTSRNPLYQAVFAMRNAYEEAADLPSLQTQWLGDWSIGARADLALVVLETRKGLLVRMEYCVDLFNRETIDSMVRSFGAILRRGLDEPQQQISTLYTSNE